MQLTLPQPITPRNRETTTEGVRKRSCTNQQLKSSSNSLKNSLSVSKKAGSWPLQKIMGRFTKTLHTGNKIFRFAFSLDCSLHHSTLMFQSANQFRNKGTCPTERPAELWKFFWFQRLFSLLYEKQDHSTRH